MKPTPTPRRTALAQNYPNPFNPETRITVAIADTGPVTLKIYDVLGNEVARILPDVSSESHFDLRYERTTGSRLTPRTHFLIARELSTAWVPSFFFPPRKLIAVDLDHTLHEGVLGELLNEVVVNDDFYLLQQ